MVDSISINEAARWLLKVASVGGEITADAQSILTQFANEYGLNLADIIFDEQQTQQEQHPIKSIDDLYREDRKSINQYLENQLKHPIKGTRIGVDTIMVTRYKQDGIAEKDAIYTLIKFIETVGYSKVESLDIKYQGRFPLVSRENICGWYKEGNNGWFVLSKFSNKLKAIYINQIADAFNLRVKAEIIGKC